MQVFWFLPTHGDSRYLGTGEGARHVDLSYLQQVAGAADRLGYEGVLIPTGRSCEDPWVIASSLIGSTLVRSGARWPSSCGRAGPSWQI